jgi:hypothetical protein
MLARLSGPLDVRHQLVSLSTGSLPEHDTDAYQQTLTTIFIFNKCLERKAYTIITPLDASPFSNDIQGNQ